MMWRTLITFFFSEWIILSTSSHPSQRQYHFIHRSFTWNEAQAYCRRTYTDLATIQNSEEMSRVMDTLRAAGHTSEVWIGLYNEVDWKWSDGFTGNGAEYRDWTPDNGEPNFYSAHQFCVVTDKNGRWWDDSCDEQYPIICYKGTQMNPSFILQNTTTWSSAQAYCRQYHTDLATIRNDTENQRVLGLLTSTSYAWIGLFRDPNFYWSDGSSFVFGNLGKGYNVIGSNRVICGVTRLDDGKWWFKSCETRRSFVCHGIPKEIKHVKLTLKTDSVNLNDPVLKANILEKLKDRLKENGVKGVTLKWKQPDGEVFKREKRRKKTEL